MFVAKQVSVRIYVLFNREFLFVNDVPKCNAMSPKLRCCQYNVFLYFQFIGVNEIILNISFKTGHSGSFTIN